MDNKPAVETYSEDGVWKSRRQGSLQVFATGGTRDKAVALGRAAAKNDGTEHLLMDPDGAVCERRPAPGRAKPAR